LYSVVKVSRSACKSVIVWGCCGWARSRFLRGLLESFDLAAGGGVVGPGVLLHDVQSAEFGLELGSATAAAGEPHGVDHPVVGQCGGGNRICGNGVAEGGQHHGSGDPVMAERCRA
jgi:hypothetical protein